MCIEVLVILISLPGWLMLRLLVDKIGLELSLGSSEEPEIVCVLMLPELKDVCVGVLFILISLPGRTMLWLLIGLELSLRS